MRTRDPKDPHRIAALVRLYNTFSPALYAYARRKYSDRAEAESAVHGFLDFIRSARLGFGHRAQRDRLRSFLLGAFQDYLDVESLKGMRPSDRHEAEFAVVDEWMQSEGAFDSPPESTFQRAWANCVISKSCVLLKEELAADSGSAAAELIAAEVVPSARRPFNPDLAKKLALSPPEALEMIRSARRRLREMILEQVRETVSAQEDVEVEFWDLFKST